MFSSAVSVGIRLNAWKTKPTLAPQQREVLVGQLRELDVADEHLAGRQRVEPGEAVHQGRLAGPGRSHDRREVTAGKRDRDAVECSNLRVAGAVDLDGVNGAGDRGDVGHGGLGLSRGHGRQARDATRREQCGMSLRPSSGSFPMLSLRCYAYASS